MKRIARKVALVLAAAAAATIGLTAVSAPSQAAMDSGWGCGGGCRVSGGR